MSTIQRYTYKAATTVLGGQNVVNLDWLKIPFQASALVDVVNGAVDYSLEFTTDDLSGAPAGFRWITVPNLPAGQTATRQYTVNFPVTAIRMNIVSITGEVRFSTVQGTGI